jgi:hypothetical protein
LGIKIVSRKIDIAMNAVIVAALGELNVKRLERASALFPRGDLVGLYFNNIRILCAHSFSTLSEKAEN